MQVAPPNPLRQLHAQAQAEFVAWDQIEIVQTFNQPQAEYAAIRKSTAMIDLPQRGIIELTGRDRLQFLNNLLTNQTWDSKTACGLQAGQGVYAFMLNRGGRIVADMNVLELGESTLLETDARFVEPLRQTLSKYVFREHLSLTNRLDQLHQIAVHGPQADSVVGATLASPLGSTRVELFGVEAIVWRDDPTGAPGYHLLVPIESAPKLWMSLLAQGVRPAGWAAFNTARIEAGRPILGIDFDGAPIASAAPGGSRDQLACGTLPAETGLLHRAVSFTKGCYLGQEIVARMHSRGQLARLVIGIRMDDQALPIAGTQVLNEQSEVVGIITSSTVSPLLSNVPICLAMVNRPWFEPGTRLKIPAEGAIRAGQVVALPFIGPQVK